MMQYWKIGMFIFIISTFIDNAFGQAYKDNILGSWVTVKDTNSILFFGKKKAYQKYEKRYNICFRIPCV